ncbi:MAG: ribonuclease, partial [Candidatus Marinimicrobia bacterium]|nr:ribonuclease [Candidatus Neomarinimicrobiota bacterium]MBT6867310.1 ribonuclease [Candidatus Neomarinimicrobiota bacterium]
MSKNLDKIFVLDTNVILHDATCIHHFENNEVVIPISVLEELDQFKRGNEQIHFNARDFLRSLDDLSTGSNNSEFNKGDGKIRVLVNHDWHPDVEASFQEDCPDHRIINCAYKLKIDNPDREVILVTKDTNMRLKSRSLGLSAEDYSRDAIEDLRQVYTGSRLVENVGTREIDELYASQGIDVAGLDSVTNPISNENFILRNGQKSILAAYDPFESKIVRVDKPTAYGIEPRNAEQSFAIHMLMDNRIQLVTLSGKAGTGKTLLAL